MASAFRSRKKAGERASTTPMASRLALLVLIPLLVAAVLAPAGTVAKPPGPAVVCDGGGAGCVVSNAYGAWGDRKQCSASAVVYPTTEEELVAAVARAGRDNLKVKAVSGFSHTIPKLSCPSSAGETLLVSTARYNSRIEVDVEKRVVTADAGVGLRALVDAVEAAGLSLVAAPYWEGVSIGGLISTGSHGSSWWGRGGAVHDHVVGLRLVVLAARSEGFAKVLAVDGRDDRLFNAARVSLGLLGLISTVTLSLEPAFKRSITYSFEDDGGVEDEFMGFARAHEFADITWYPSQRAAVYRHDDRVSVNTSGDGENDFIGFRSTSVLVSTAVRAAEKASEKARSTEGKCAMAAAEVAYKRLVANGLRNNRSAFFTGYPVVGRQGRMQTSGSCSRSPASDVLSTCAWDPRIRGLFFYETTAMLPASRFRDFVADVKRLRDLKPENFCGVDVYNGLLIRFVGASEAYLGQPEDSVAVDFNYFRADEAAAPRLHQDVWEEVEQMAFFKYEARPHWGKNRKVAFLGVGEKYPGLAEFRAARARLDPGGMFSSEWSEEVLLGNAGAMEDGCAMEGLCICSEDRHCNPRQGYLCRPGLVYQEARVCRYSANSAAAPPVAAAAPPVVGLRHTPAQRKYSLYALSWT